MDIHQKKLSAEIDKWNNNLDVLFEVETEYRSKLVEKYRNKIVETKSDFITYGHEHKYKIVEKNNFIEIEYGSKFVVLRVSFTDPTPSEYYKFDFSLKEVIRREYFVYIIPEQNNFRIPKLSESILHPQPANIEEAKHGIKSIAEEILKLQEKINDIDKIVFKYACHNEQKKYNEIEELRRFDNFSSIVEYLIKNQSYLYNK